MAKRTFYCVAILPIVYYLYIRGTTDYELTAYMSFSSRTITTIVLPGLILGALIVHWANREVTKFGIFTLSMVYLTLLVINAVDNSKWTDVRTEISTVVAAEGTFLSIEDTKLAKNQHRWSWNNSLLGLVWSYPCVNTIILNGEDHVSIPFDPRRRLILKRYLRYSPTFKSIDQDIRLCAEEK